MNTPNPALEQQNRPSKTAQLEVRFTTALYRDEQRGREMEVFRLILGDESILLLPLKNWTQLDIHKWVPRGKLPASPAGLEITADHVKLAGEIVKIQDPEGCDKLEKTFREWLTVEYQSLELAKKQAHAKPVATAQETTSAAPQRPRFQVEIDKTGQVHVKCVQGKEVLALIGLNQSGFKSLISQGLMRKPHALQVGALHDWVEIDSQLFSFERGNNDAAKLETALNEQYLPTVNQAEGKDIIFYANAASATGFDVQFPVRMAGVKESKRRPLNEESLELLQDPVRCGLLHQNIVIKLARPNFVFKLKDSEGGERYLSPCAENLVSATDEDGNEKTIDLSHPINYLHLSTGELTAIFNHAAIHKHGRPSSVARTSELQQSAPMKPLSEAPAKTSSEPLLETPVRSTGVSPVPPPVLPSLSQTLPETLSTLRSEPGAPSLLLPSASKNQPPGEQQEPAPGPAEPTLRSPVVVEPPQPRPNAWLEPVLSQPAINHQWLVCIIYSKMAEYLRTSNPGKLGAVNCWSIPLDDIEDVEDTLFRGVFLTEKNGFGYINQDRLVRFNKGVVLFGTQQSALEAIGVSLLASGFDLEGNTLFIVTEGYLKKFGVPENTVLEELAILKSFGAIIMDAKQLLESPVAIDILWTVPAAQENPEDPQAVESRNPEEPPDAATAASEAVTSQVQSQTQSEPG